MKRLLIDISQILKADMHVMTSGENSYVVEFEGEEVKIPHHLDAVEVFYASLQKTLRALNMTPCQVILIKDGKGGKDLRRQWLPGYSVRPAGAPEFMEEFYKAQDIVEETVLLYGGLSVSKEGFEADDVGAALAKVCDCICWSGDKDWLAFGDVFYDGQISPDKFMGLAREHIVIYKTLTGDSSDKIPGAVGFGPGAFQKMIIKYGDDVCDDFIDMLEDEDLSDLEDYVAEFKPFAKILADPENVINCYKCVKTYDPLLNQHDWKMLYPAGNGVFKQWEPTMELITADNFSQDLLDKLRIELREGPFNSYDIEGYTTEEGQKWREANKNKQGKMPMDTLGQRITGFSLNCGANRHKNYYFSIEHADTANLTLEQAEHVLNSLPEDIPTVVHHSTFELPVTRMHWDLRFDRGWLPQMTHDTEIMAGYVDEEELSGLKHQSKLRMGYDQITYAEVLGGKSGMNELTGLETISYGCDDSICTGQLYSLCSIIMQYEQTWYAYETVDVVPPFIYSERFINGIRFDMDKLDELEAESQKAYDEHYSKIQDFLRTFTWEESVEKQREFIRITPENLAEVMAARKNESDEDYEVVTKRWPGCEFIPAAELTPAEIKRLYLDYFGEPLVTKVRKLEKLAGAIPDKEFSDLVLNSDLDGLNSLCAAHFVSNPQIGLQSPNEMQSLLYDALGFPVRLRNKCTATQRANGQRQGNPKADEAAIRHAIVFDLEKDSPVAEFLKTVIAAKSCLTEQGLYFRPYRNMPHYLDGMVHPQFRVSAQKTGRGTASMPNDAQVARDSGIRKVYCCPESDDPNDPYVFISFDEKSQELLHVAEHCKDENMMACFRGEKRDIHSVTGAAIYNLRHPEAPCTYEEFYTGRKVDGSEMKAIRKEPAKRTNFLKVYNGTEATLAVQLLIPVEEAEAMLVAQDAEFPGIGIWVEESAERNRERGYTTTPMGRRRHIRLDGTWKDNHEIRSAGNQPIQGGAAEQIKLILKRLWQEEVYEKFDAYFFGTVHDESNSCVRMSQVVEFAKYVHPIMIQHYADFTLEFDSSIEIGWNFGDLVEIGESVDVAKIEARLEEMRNERKIKQ